MPAPTSCFALCTAVPHVNDFEDYFEEESQDSAGRSRYEEETALGSDVTSELGFSGGEEDEEEEDDDHEEVFDIERLRWENREEQHLDRLVAEVGRGGPFARLSELRVAINDAEMVGVPQSKLEAARCVLRASVGTRRQPVVHAATAEVPGLGLPAYIGNVHRGTVVPAW
eukprot:CAMPEP_0179073616 /NCGR_PEP_ID=MMETSP0796-20121207/32662_1 /TAXON_ID=73915 /ORGANISM="Pyrodinium bahamense, Strain pbaha01" /LENGTH=169 /DNA_ID=CAMNT_0020770813 /DNA_START=17 /DNA_END=526 /DNA_ORIENTATION=+